MTTIQDLVTQVRSDLDESVAAVWTDSDLSQWLNAGIYRTLTKLKSIRREDWLTKRLASTDGALTINGSSYTASSMKLVADTTIYTLPPDLVEIRLWQPLTQADRDSGIVMIARDFSDVEFQQAIRLSSASSTARYFYDLMGVNQLVVAPTPAVSIETELYYVRFNGTLALGDTIDILPAWAYEPVKSYCRYRALSAINHPDAAMALSQFKDDAADTRSFASPRESQDPQIVEGIFDEDDQWPLFVDSY